MNSYKLTYRHFGDNAILIDWPQEINKEILHDMLRFKTSIEAAGIASIREIVMAYASMTLFIDNSSSLDNLIDQLKAIYQQPTKFQLNTKNWQIPVCYDRNFGIDLEYLGIELKMDIEEIITIHSRQKYLIHFIGFLPGFLYLGGLDDRIHFPRKKVPALNIPNGSVGIGGSQTGIYPVDSPGGWNIIGKTPVPLFDTTKDVPCFVSAGDTIQFVPIGMEEFMNEEKRIESESNEVNSSDS